MQKKKQLIRKIFRVLASVFCLSLLVIMGAIFYTYQISNKSLDKFLPSNAEYVIELKPNNLAENLVKQYWGERGAKLAYRNGRIVFWNQQTLFCQNSGSSIAPLSTLYYRGFEFQNMLSGENDWQVEKSGWFFSGTQNALRKLVDFWLSNEDNLAQNAIWQELKNSSVQGDLSLFLLQNNSLQADFWQGTSLVLSKNNLQILTLLDRTLVQEFGYGKSRERYLGELLEFAPSDSWLVVGGQNLSEQVAQVAQILAKSSPELSEWIKFNFADLPKFSEGEQLLSWQGDNFKNMEIALEEPQNDFMSADFARYATGAERWVGLLYPAQNSQAQEICQQILGFIPRLIFVGQQAFDDRILTTINFE